MHLSKWNPIKRHLSEIAMQTNRKRKQTSAQKINKIQETAKHNFKSRKEFVIVRLFQIERQNYVNILIDKKDDLFLALSKH